MSTRQSFPYSTLAPPSSFFSWLGSMPSALRAQRRTSRFTWTAAICFLIVGTIASLLTVRQLQSASKERAQERFGRLSQDLVSVAQQHIAQFANDLYGLRRLYSTRESVTRAELDTYIQSHEADPNFRPETAIGFIRRVPRAQLDAFVADQQAEGEPPFAVRFAERPPLPADHDRLPDRAPDELYIIQQVEPAAVAQPILGFDIGSDPEGRDAADRAMRTGQPVLSGTIPSLKAHAQGEALYLLPVYTARSRSVMPDDPRDALIGWVFKLVPMDLLQAEVEDAMDSHLASVELDEDLRSPQGAGPVTLVMPEDAGPSEVSDRSLEAFRRRATFPAAGRQWTLTTTSTPAFESDHACTLLTPLVAGGGACMSILSALVALSLGGGWALTMSVAQSQRRLALAEAASECEATRAIAAGVAHELGSLIFGASIPLLQDGRDRAPARETQVGKAALHLEQAQTLTASLLDFLSQPDTTPPRALALHAWLPEAVATLTSAAPSGITVTTEIESNLPEVMIHPLGLAQILRNLLFNAADAMPRGGEVRVTASHALADGRQLVEIRVADNGPGVPEELRNHIFDHGFSTRSRPHRSGLGLPIALQILKLFGGTLSYQPNTPNGSVFAIRLVAHSGADA